MQLDKPVNSFNLFKIIHIYLQWLLKYFVFISLVLLLSSFSFYLIANYKSNDLNVLVLTMFLTLMVTCVSLFLVSLKVFTENRITIKKCLLFVLLSLIFGLANVLLVSFGGALSSIVFQFVQIFIDILFMILLVKMILNNKKLVLQNEFIIKFGLFYFVTRIIILLIFSILLIPMVSIEARPSFVPTIGHFSRLILLPILAIHFNEYEEINKNQKLTTAST